MMTPISHPTAVRFGQFSKTQIEEIEEARRTSARRNYQGPLLIKQTNGIDTILDDIVSPGPRQPEPTVDLDTLPMMGVGKAKKLINALASEIRNGLLGPLPFDRAMGYRNKLDDVVQKLHKAALQIPDTLVEEIKTRYDVAYLNK